MAPFHAILQLQRDLRTGQHQHVLSLLNRRLDAVSPRGMLYLSPGFLTAFLLLAGTIKIVGTNYMLDALRPGPYAHLFSIASYIGTALWWAVAIVSVVWYRGCLNELKREARALATFTSGDVVGRQH